MLVDIIEKGVRVGIEAGCAYALGKPLVTIAHHTADISTTLHGISTAVLTYADPAELETRLAQLWVFQSTEASHPFRQPDTNGIDGPD